MTKAARVRRSVPCLLAGASAAALISAAAAQATSPPPAQPNPASPSSPSSPEAPHTLASPVLLDPDAAQPRNDVRSPTRWRVETGARFIATGEADEEDNAGSLSLGRLGAWVSPTYVVNDRLALSIELDFEASFYDFDDDGVLIPSAPADAGDPFDDVIQFTIGPGARYAVNDQLTLFGGAIVVFAGEPGADAGESVIAGGFVAGSYKVSDTLRLGIGFAITSSLDEEVFFAPIPLVEWDITPTLRLSTGGDNQLQGLRLAWSPLETWSFAFEGGFARTQYRFEDDNRALPGGGVTDTSILLGGAVTWKAAQRLTLTGRVGAIATRELEFFDDEGDEVADAEFDPTVYAGLTASLQF